MVVTAGAWTGELLPSVSHLLQPERQAIGWFQPNVPDQFTPENCPVFVADVEEGHYYRVPQYDVTGFKLGKFNHRFEAGEPADLRRAGPDG